MKTPVFYAFAKQNPNKTTRYIRYVRYSRCRFRRCGRVF